MVASSRAVSVLLGGVLALAAPGALSASAAVPAQCEPGGSGCYPPPDQPTTSTSASTVRAQEPLTVCGEHYQADATLRLTDDGRPVTTLQTGPQGKGCTRIEWTSPQAKAREVGPASSALGGETALRGGGVLAGGRLALPAAAQQTVCHDVATSGPDQGGQPATSSTTVCVEPRDPSPVRSKRTAATSPVRSAGLDALGVLAIVAAGAALLFGGLRPGRRRRAG
jgi:hypothetical protein